MNAEELHGFAGIKAFGDNFFIHKTTLKKLSGFNNVNQLHAATFYYCVNLESLSGFAGVARIRENVFSDCSSLVSVPDFANVTTIGYTTFAGCTSLTAISFSDKLSSVGDNAFHRVPLLTLNLFGRVTPSNNITGACSLLAGKGQTASITTFNFSLGAEVTELDELELIDYLNNVIELERPALLTSALCMLDLGNAEVEISELTSHGDLFDTIKQGENTYTWSGAIWKRKEEE
jgi:hypothetical protein